MAKLCVKPGSTSVSVYIFIEDSSSTTGAGLTGLAYNSSSLTAYYVRSLGSATAITLATQTVTGAYSSGGFVEVSSSNMPGVYRLDLPDAALAVGVRSVVVMLKGATNMAPLRLEIDLNAEVNVTHFAGTAATLYDGVAQAGGSTSITLAATASSVTDFYKGRSIELVGNGTGAGQVRIITAYNGTTKVATVHTAWATTPDSTSWYLLGPESDANTVLIEGTDATDAIDARLTAYGVSTLTAAGIRTAVGLASANLDTQLSTIAGYIDTEVAAILAAVDTEVAAIKTKTDQLTFTTSNKVDANTIQIEGSDATDTIDARIDARLAAYGVSTLTAAGIRTAVGMSSANLDTQLSAIAGYIDTEVAAILAAVDTEVAAIKTKTDQLTFTTSNKVDATLTLATDVGAAAANRVADHVLRRTQPNVEASSYGDTIADAASIYGIIQQLQKSNTTANPGYLTVYMVDGTTLLEQLVLTTSSSADPVTGIS